VAGVIGVSVEVEAGVLQVDIMEEVEVLEELAVAAITAAKKDIGRMNVKRGRQTKRKEQAQEILHSWDLQDKEQDEQIGLSIRFGSIITSNHKTESSRRLL